MKKKLKYLSIVILMFSFSCSFNVQASESTILLKENKEITNIEQLYKNAINNVTDNEEIEKELSSELIIKGDNKVFSSDNIISTTQLLKSELEEDRLMESYATTVFSEANLEEIIKDNQDRSMIHPSSSQREEGYGNDPSLSVKAYSTLYYDVSTKDNVQHFKLTSVTGGWTSIDARVFFKNTKLRVQASGITYYSTNGNSNCLGRACTYNFGPYSVGSTFSKSFSMIPITKSSGSKFLTTQTATLYDASDSWTMTFNNKLFK